MSRVNSVEYKLGDCMLSRFHIASCSALEICILFDRAGNQVRIGRSFASKRLCIIVGVRPTRQSLGSQPSLMSIPSPKTHSSVPGLSSPTALRPAIKHGPSSSRPTSPSPTPQLVLSPPQGTSALPPSHSNSIAEEDGSRQLRTPSGAGGYTTKVSFDTFAGPPEADSLFSFTLQVSPPD